MNNNVDAKLFPSFDIMASFATNWTYLCNILQYNAVVQHIVQDSSSRKRVIVLIFHRQTSVGTDTRKRPSLGT